ALPRGGPGRRAVAASGLSLYHQQKHAEAEAACCKAIALRPRLHARASKRGGGTIVSASALVGAEDAEAAFAEFVSCEPAPAFAAEVAESCQRLLGALT